LKEDLIKISNGKFSGEWKELPYEKMLVSVGGFGSKILPYDSIKSIAQVSEINGIVKIEIVFTNDIRVDATTTTAFIDRLTGQLERYQLPQKQYDKLPIVDDLKAKIILGVVVVLVMVGIFNNGGSNDSKSSYSTYQVNSLCKTYVAQEFGKSTSIMRADYIKEDAGGHFSKVWYTRSSDNTRWDYVCHINNNKILWAALNGSELGRWRYEDEKRIGVSNNGKLVIIR